MWTLPQDEADGQVSVKHLDGKDARTYTPGDELVVTLFYSGDEDLLIGPHSVGYHNTETYGYKVLPRTLNAEVNKSKYGSEQVLSATIRVPEDAKGPLRFGIAVQVESGEKIGYLSEALDA